jgi:hypothetical protein
MNDDQWFYLVDNRSLGPVSNARFLALLGESSISKSTPVWKDGTEGWRPLGEALASSLATPPALPFDGMRHPPAAASTEIAQPTSVVQEADATIPRDPREWADTNPHPWRRYFARMLDTLVSGQGWPIVHYGMSPTTARSADRCQGVSFRNHWTPGC